MAQKKNLHFGGLPPRYGFILNPYPNERVSRCPICEQKNRQRKLPLLIHVDPNLMFALNYTCRYCPACDLLVAHKHAIEGLLAALLRHHNPGVIGNDYLILGTLEKSMWRENMKRPQTIDEIRLHTSDFAIYYKELRQTRPGYYHVSQKPPIMEPPPSKEWVKT